ELRRQIEQHLERMPNQMVFFQYNLVDSHDGPRFHNTPQFSPDMLRGMLILLFLLPGTPSIYYGSEVGIAGGTPAPDTFRYPMEWNRDRWDVELFDTYRTLARLKSTEEAFQFGSYKFLYADESAIALARFSDDKIYVGAVSNAPDDREICVNLLPAGAPK